MSALYSLASGSKGNAYLLQMHQKNILIDCGLSFKALQLRLLECNSSFEKIDAIFITHEHLDHIRGLKIFFEHRGVPLYCNYQTANAIYQICKKKFDFKVFTTDECFDFESIQVMPFSVQHDAFDPVGYTFEKEVKVGVCTDLGFVSRTVEHHLLDCDYLILEANHEPKLVHASKRPPIYKERVLGGFGHLSNEACAQLLKKMKRLKSVCLAHFSEECNHESFVHEAMKGIEVDYFIGKQHQAMHIKGLALNELLKSDSKVF
jgi:phosphoribosyl 1,2-cyclic phosphodiesterase